MSIVFTYTVSPNQVHILQRVRDWTDRTDPMSDIGELSRGVKSWIAGTRSMISEGYVTMAMRPVPDKYRESFGTHVKEIPCWSITPKGRALLALIELDIHDQMKNLRGSPVLKQINRKPGRIEV